MNLIVASFCSNSYLSDISKCRPGLAFRTCRSINIFKLIIPITSSLRLKVLALSIRLKSITGGVVCINAYSFCISNEKWIII